MAWPILSDGSTSDSWVMHKAQLCAHRYPVCYTLSHGCLTHAGSDITASTHITAPLDHMVLLGDQVVLSCTPGNDWSLRYLGFVFDNFWDPARPAGQLHGVQHPGSQKNMNPFKALVTM